MAAPSSISTALALRQAIWRKSQPSWHVYGIPQVLYTDHGSDFTSQHLEQVTADLKIQLIFSAAGRPRGRGKIERFFNSLNQVLLSQLPGYASNPEECAAVMTLPELTFAIERYLPDEYFVKTHRTTKEAPQARWDAGGFLPQMPESLEQLDLLLLTVPKTRRVQQDVVVGCVEASRPRACAANHECISGDAIGAIDPLNLIIWSRRGAISPIPTAPTRSCTSCDTSSKIGYAKRELGEEISVNEYKAKQVVPAFDSPPGDEYTAQLREANFFFRADRTWNADYTAENQRFAYEFVKDLPNVERSAARSALRTPIRRNKKSAGGKRGEKPRTACHNTD